MYLTHKNSVNHPYDRLYIF